LRQRELYGESTKACHCACRVHHTAHYILEREREREREDERERERGEERERERETATYRNSRYNRAIRCCCHQSLPLNDKATAAVASQSAIISPHACSPQRKRQRERVIYREYIYMESIRKE